MIDGSLLQCKLGYDSADGRVSSENAVTTSNGRLERTKLNTFPMVFQPIRARVLSNVVEKSRYSSVILNAHIKA
jgi:hypothetical protein